MIPGLGRFPGEGNGNPLQYSCLGNLMDRGAWWAKVHGMSKNQTRLSDKTTIPEIVDKDNHSNVRILSPQAPAELMINTRETCMCLSFPLECQLRDLCVLLTAVSHIGEHRSWRSFRTL